MSTIGELNVVLTADVDQYMNAIRQVQNQTNNVMGRVNNVISSVKKTIATALGTAAIVSFGKSCIELGSDLAEVQNVVDVTFTTMSDSVDKFAKSAASSFGLSETMAKKYVGTFGAMASAFGFTEQEAYKMSTTLAGLSGDVASFYNISQDEAYNKIKSVFTGETETLKELGIVMTENALNSYAQAQGINSTVSAMSEQEKVALRYQFVLQQLNLAQGDFSRTSDSWANQVRILQLRFESFKATLGQGLINVFLPVIKVLNAVIARLQVFAQYFSAITGALFGKAQANATNTSKATTGLGNSVTSLGTGANNTSNALKKASNATKKTGTAAKKAKKEIKGLIGGLDEINNLSSNSTAGTSGTSPSSSSPSSGTGGVGGIGDLGLGDLGTIDMGSTIDTSGLDSKVKKIKDTFDKIRKIISDNKDIIISIMTGLMAGLGVVLIANWSKIGGIFARNFPLLTKIFTKLGKVIFKPFSLLKKGIGFLLGLNPVVAAVVVAITILVGALTYLWRTNKDFRDNVIKTWKMIKDALQPWIEGFVTLFKVLADIVGTVVVGAFKLVGKAILKVVEVFAGDVMSDLQKSAPTIKKLGEGFKKFAKNVEKCWKQIKKFSFKKWIKEKKKEISDGFKRISDDFKDIGEEIQKDWDNAVESVKEFVIDIRSKVEDFNEKAQEKWEDVQDWIKDKVLEIGAKITDFYEEVKNKLDEAKKWIKDKAIEIGTKVLDFIESVQNKLGEAKKWIKDKALEVGAKVSSFYDKAKEMFNNAKNSIKTWFLSVGAKVGSFYDKAKEGFNTAKNIVKNWAFNVGAKVASFYEKAKERYDNAKKSIKSWSFTIAAKVGSFYDKVKSAYNSAKGKIKGWAFSVSLKISTTASNIKSTINGIIKKINSAVMGKIKFTVPSWVPVFGGKTWKAPTIPYLAKGGIVDSATLAMIGEAGKEAVIPLENNTQGLDLLANKLQSRMATNNVSTFSGFSKSGNNEAKEVYNGDVIIKLDGNTVFKQSVVSILRQMKRQGITI